MKVSIIIPIYKVENFIERCLLSALNQTYPETELVLVNDCTPDNSMDIVRKILENHPAGKNTIVINHEMNRGLSAARNSGIKHASGDYLYFLDSDDELPPNAISILASIARDTNPDLVLGEIDVIGAERSKFSQLKLKENRRYEKEEIMRTFLSCQWYEMAWNKLVKREIFTVQNCWFKEGILHEDNLWSFQLALCAESMSISQEKTYIYHIQQQSITQKKSEKNLDSLYAVLQEMIGISEKNNLFYRFPQLTDYLDNLRIYFIKSLLVNNFDKQYVTNQIKNINALFTEKVRKKRAKSLKTSLKEMVLFLLSKLK